MSAAITSVLDFGLDERVHLMHVAGDPHEPHGERADYHCN